MLKQFLNAHSNWLGAVMIALIFGALSVFAQESPGNSLNIAPSTTPANELISAPSPQAPLQPSPAVVITRVLEVYSSPSAKALVLLQLKQGTPVEIIASNGDFLKIRYKIEGEFSVEGYANKAGLLVTELSQTNSQFQNKEQNYDEPLRSEPQTEAYFPKNAPNERPADSLWPKTKERDSSIAVARPLKRKQGKIMWDAQLGLGLQKLSESLTTKPEGSDTYATEPFLSYEMSGILMEVSGRMNWSPVSSFEAGLFLRYGFTVFRGTVANESSSFSPNIDRSNVQGMLNSIQAGPFLRYEFVINPRYSLAPELSAIGAYQLFTVNQLKSKDNLLPGVDGQTVLMNWQLMQLNPELALTVRGPLNLSLRPYVSVGLLTRFSESPTVTISSSGSLLPEDQMIRTGAPGSSTLNINYGASFDWNLKRFGLETISISAFFHYRDISRNFSGSGNRAGLLMRDTKASTQLTSFGLGGQYLF